MTGASAARLPVSVRIRIEDDSQIGEARRCAQAMAMEEWGDATRAGQLAIAATELATNIRRHGGGEGSLLLQPFESGKVPFIELFAIDSGPGMHDVERCLVDGYSTAGSAGTGLGAVRRLACVFDIYSSHGAGCAVFARFAPASASRTVPEGPLLGTLCLPLEGESECGDAWRVNAGAELHAIMVVDGLGHGSGAAQVAHAAVLAFDRSKGAPQDTLESVHSALQGSRGGAVAIAGLSDGRLRYAAMGNISGSIVANDRSRGLMSHNGTVGLGTRRLRELDYEWPPGALLIMHSDGLTTRWRLEEYPGLALRHPGLVAAVLFRDHARGRDDATILVAALGSAAE